MVAAYPAQAFGFAFVIECICVLQVLLIAGCKALLVGKLQPGKLWKKNDAYNLQRTLMLIGQIPFSHTFVSISPSRTEIYILLCFVTVQGVQAESSVF
jgi:hypothetical protein